MMNDPQELSGNLSRVNSLGTATERLFSRLYGSLRRKSNKNKQIEHARQAGERNRQLQRAIKRRDLEIDRLNGILATIDEGIIMQDLDGRIILVNASARKLIGSRKEFWESELGGLFNAYKDILTVESELAPLGEPTRIQVNNMIVGAQVAAVGDGQASAR
jgi:signal transduction histidine kinase